MSPKELLYIEDALGHEQIFIAQCNNAAQTLQDPELKMYAKEMADKHQQIFNSFYGIL